MARKLLGGGVVDAIIGEGGYDDDNEQNRDQGQGFHWSDGVRLVCGSLNVIAGVFDIPTGTADGVAAACAEERDHCGRE